MPLFYPSSVDSSSGLRVASASYEMPKDRKTSNMSEKKWNSI